MQNKRAVTVRCFDIKCLTFPTILKDIRLTFPPLPRPSPSLSSLSINFQVMRLSKLLYLVFLVYALLRSNRHHEDCEIQFHKKKKNFNESYLFLRKTRAKLY